MSAESDPQVPNDAMTVTNNPDAGRYELHVGGDLAAFVTYR